MTDLTPSRAIDAALHEFIQKDYVLSLKAGYFSVGGEPVPQYTTRIDDALILVEKALPGWQWRMHRTSTGVRAGLAPDFDDPDHADRFRALWPRIGLPFEEGPGVEMTLDAPCPALALVGCLLAVLHGIEENRHPCEDFRELADFSDHAELVDKTRVKRAMA